MKKIILGVLFLFLTIALSGCKNKYNAKIYGKRDQIISDKFLDNNHVYRAGYYKTNEDGKIVHYYEEDESMPLDRTFIVNDQTTLDTMINENKLTVDFNTQTVLVYLYFSYYIRELNIKKISYKKDSKTIKISFNTKHKAGYKDNAGPQASYAVVVLDKLDITTCNFSYSD